MLSLILKREVYNVDLDANKRMYGNSDKSKIGRLDIRVKFNDGENCNIELQVADYELEQTKGISHYHTKWNLREEKNSERTLTNDIEMHILEIPKLKNADIQNDELAHWLMFIDNPDSEEVEKFMCENKFWKQAREENEAKKYSYR